MKSWLVVGLAPRFKPQSLYELSWTHAQDAKMVLDVGTGLLVDVNPAFETLMGCSRENLIGTDYIGLHPEDERDGSGTRSANSRARRLYTPGFISCAKMVIRSLCRFRSGRRTR